MFNFSHKKSKRLKKFFLLVLETDRHVELFNNRRSDVTYTTKKRVLWSLTKKDTGIFVVGYEVD